MNPVICSCGALGQAIVDLCVEKGAGFYIFEERMPDHFDVSKPDIAIFCGKKNQEKFEKFIDFCERKELPLINASTDVKVPEGRNVAIINAPNLSLPILSLMRCFPHFIMTMQRFMTLLGIVEAHQKTKSSTSGTAVKIAKLINFDKEKISVVRDDALAVALGVPAEYLGAHAYHIFPLEGQGIEMEFKIKVHGRRTYALGAHYLMEAILRLESPLRRGNYDAEQILFDPNFI